MHMCPSRHSDSLLLKLMTDASAVAGGSRPGQPALPGLSPALQPEIQTLHLGLSLVGFGHFMVLLPLWDFPEAGSWLHVVASYWGICGSIGTIGALSSVGASTAGKP